MNKMGADNGNGVRLNYLLWFLMGGRLEHPQGEDLMGGGGRGRGSGDNAGRALGDSWGCLHPDVRVQIGAFIYYSETL